MKQKGFTLIPRLRSGFTLIELLVVIAIIGLLASVVMVALGSTRIKARDGRRAGDLRQIRNALELYFANNSHYPDTQGNWSCFDCSAYINAPIFNPAASSIASALSPYMSAAPKDPRNRFPGTDAGYLYFSNSGGSEFKVMAWRTPENMKNYSTNMIDYSRCGTVDSNGFCTLYGPNYNVVGIWSPGGTNY